MTTSEAAVTTVDEPIEVVLGAQRSQAGKKRLEGLKDGLGLHTVGDLLWHLPRRYLPTGEPTTVADLEEGQVLTVVGEVVRAKPHRYTDKRKGGTAYRLEVALRTDGPDLQLVFFAKRAGVAGWQQKQYAEGRQLLVSGQVRRFRNQWQLANPQALPLDDPENLDDADDPGGRAALESLRGLYPLYPASQKVSSWDLQRLVAFARTLVEELPEVVPAPVREQYGVLDVASAVAQVHAPADEAEVDRARYRFRFAEALVTQVLLARRRSQAREQGGRPSPGREAGVLTEFDARLPFPLTGDQQRVGEEIATDLAGEHPMNRLLQGEVGSGKTLVALRAMLQVVDSGGQAALLAPTEVLAQQHARSLRAMLDDLGRAGELDAAEHATRVELLTGSMTKGQRREPLLAAASGEAGIVVGTHALLQSEVSFADLGLVVVDEQHRFGVEQRAALTAKADPAPHLLVMTATPIPRTVAMTVFGDLEVSTLRELPAGRAEVQTTVVPLAEHPSWADRVWARVSEEVERGRQAYVVCPRVTADEDPATGAEDPATAGGAAAAVEELGPWLASGPLASCRVATLHGQQPAEEKEQAMRAFAAGEVDVLVATTVIEVGVDVANATVMVVLDADRFGVSQLHQLRGRIGRGEHGGLCLLVTSVEGGGPAEERLGALAHSSDGFELARVDLQQRREGDVLGARQSGRRSSLENLRVLRDEETIEAAREAAVALLARDPGLAQEPALRAEVTALEDTRRSDFVERS